MKNRTTYRCPMCNQTKNIEEFYLHQTGKDRLRPVGYCKTCNHIRSKEWKHTKGGVIPISEAKESPSWLADISEQVLARYFNHITRMPRNNPGFDLICDLGYLIDVKSACSYIDTRSKHPVDSWNIEIERNKIPHYFMILVFNNRQSLQPKHVWLIPGPVINHLITLHISNTEKCLTKWSKYEKSLDKVIACCNRLRE
jgi:hypothetical protein